MGADLETLFKLQEIDLRLLDKQREIDKFEKALAERRQAMESCQARIDLATARRKELVSERAFAERRVADSEDQLKERRSRLSRIRTERELRATEGEITSARDEIGTYEEELLELEQRVTDVEAQIETLRGEYTDLAEADHRLVEEEGTRVEALKVELASEREARDRIASDLDGGLARKYEMVLKRRGGVAVVEVRSGSCGGCHMHVPPQIVIEIMKAGAIHICPNCQRILYASGA
ncbi:MAG: zinc ribbon domain-containing protein [Candidatus Binatia bacterium]